MKQFYRSLFLLTLFVIGLISTSQASHFAGGDVSYECVGQDSFIVTLNLFRDCAGANAPASVNMSFASTCGGTANATLTQTAGSGAIISQLCPAQANNSTCNPNATNPYPGLQQYTYSALVVLSPPCNVWTMEWNSCCRNAASLNLTNANGADQYIFSEMYSGVDSCNNSPYFTGLPIPYVCINQVVNYNFGVVEPDGDSIVYFMSPAYEDANTLVTYAAPFTFDQPLPGANTVLNQTNGQLTFTPTALGTYVVAVRIEEYDINTGVIKHTSIRDIQVVVQNCTNVQGAVNSPGITNLTGNGTQLDSNSIEICVGDSFSFDISFTDPDTLDSLTLSHNIFLALDSTAVVTITNGNPASMNVAWTAGPFSPSFTSFAVNGVDDACPIPGIVSAVFNVHIIPSTYAGYDEDICDGTEWADLLVVGGTNFIWTVLSGSPIDTVPTSPNFNMTCMRCETPSVSPQVTTVYEVINLSPIGCYNRDTITVNVHPNFNLTMPNDTIICPIDSISLLVSSDEPTFSYVYNWAPAYSLSDNSIMNPTAFPDVATNYSVTVVSGGCQKSASVFVDLSPPFPPGITILGDTTICLGDTTQLEASLGDVTPANCGLSTGPCIGVVNDGIIGTGAQVPTTTGYPNPYGRFYWGAKHQILYTAAELYAMGMLNGGKITSLAFDVTTVGAPNNMDNYTIRMGCTGSTDLTGGWETGLVTVLPAATYNVVTGWNTHQFTTAYDWDGISNLVIEVCYNNSNYSSAASSLAKYTPTTFTSVLYYRGDNANVCSNTNSTQSVNRPNIKFEYCSGADPTAFNFSWSPNINIDSVNSQTPSVWPVTTSTYTVVVQDTFGSCSDTIGHQVEIVTEFDAGFSMLDTVCLNGGIVTCIPNIGGGIFSGTGIVDDSNGIFDPMVSGMGRFGINYYVESPTGNCVNDSTIFIQVIPSSDPSFELKEFCVGSSAQPLIPVTSGGIWSGTGMVDPTSGIFDPTGLPAGNYLITYTLIEPCNIDTTQTIRIIEPYTFLLTNAIVPVCEGDSVDLNPNYTLSSNPLQGNGPVVANWSTPSGFVDSLGIFHADSAAVGDYIITLTIEGEDGTCGSTQTFTVTVNPVDYAVAAADLAYCSNDQQARIFINPWLFGAGVTYTQTPIAPFSALDSLTIIPYGQNGEFDATVHGSGQWQFEMTYENVYGCIGITTDTIHVLDTPVSPVIDDAIYCQGDSVYLSATGVNQDSIYWYSDFLLTNLIGIGNPQYWGIAPDPATGAITVYTTENDWVCVSPRVTYELPVKPAPVASFTMSYTDTSGTQLLNEPHVNSPIFGLTPLNVTFNALNVAVNDTITWYHHWEVQPPNASTINTSGSSTVNWNYILPNMDKSGVPIAGTLPYTNQLVVTNEFGCSDTAFSAIYSVASEQFYNVFTPNGDGVNDVFIVPVFGLTDYKVEVFNRWGRMVYEWTDPNGGWNGEDQPDGVYFYVISGKNNDATKSEYKKQGTVTLTGSSRD